MQKFVPPAFFILTWVLALASPGQLVMADTIHFVEEADWPPFTPPAQRVGDIATKGLAFEMIRELCRRVGVACDVELVPESRALMLLKNGQRDGITTISRNVEREAFLDFSLPTLQKRGFIYFNKERRPGFTWNRWKDLLGLSIGIVNGHNYGDEFTAAASSFGLDVQSVSREEINFAKLDRGHIDVVLSVDVVAASILRSNPGYLGHIAAASKPYYLKDYHLGLAKASPAVEMMPRFNEAIKSMADDGSFKRLLAPYLGP